MPKAELDAQGKLFWHYAMYAGWSAARIAALLQKRWQVTHWNALNENEKRAAINIMKSYAAASDRARDKAMRSRIVVIIKKAGKDLAWLHESMESWGMGDSMRKLKHGDLLVLWDMIVKLFPQDDKQGVKEQ